MLRKSISRIQKQRAAENEDLRARLDEAEETLSAIRSGEVDALVVSGVGGEQIFTLKGADRSYRILIEDMNEGALTLTTEGIILYANRRFAEMLKTPLEKVIGSSISTWVAPDSQPILQSLLRKGVDEKCHEQLVLSAGDGTEVPIKLSVSNLPINEIPDTLCMVTTDLTEQKRSETLASSEKLAQGLLAASNQSRLELLSVIENKNLTETALRESEERYRTIIENIEDGYFEFDIAGNITFLNNSACRMFGTTYAGIMGMNYREYTDKENSKILYQAFNKVFRTGESSKGIAYETIRKDGTKRYMGSSASLIRNTSGQPIGFRSIMRDITEHKRAEEKIRTSLREKETMLKEIHHRVKNNLQVISSLLAMQSSYLQDEKSKEMLQNSIGRVRTMAMIHTQLYQSVDLARIDFANFIRDLVGRLRQSYVTAISPIEIHVDVTDVSLPIDTSIPCGLILNELVSNALKHAFPEGRGGEINISMATVGNRFVLKVRDNGIGLPESVDFQNPRSLGLELVNLLVGQIDSTIDLHVEGGTTFTVTFPATGK